jgi:hypothetical protein
MQASTAQEARAEERSHHTPAHRRPHQRWWRFGFPVLLVVLALLIPALVVIGARIVLDSNDGKIVKTITDPTAPGWEASVEPTPVLGVALVNELGQLDSVAVLALSGEQGGSVVVLPSSTVMGVPNVGNVPLSIVYGTGGIDVLRQGLEGILGIGVADIEVVEPNEWADLVGPVGPLEFDNPDQVVASDAGETEVLFDKGEITVRPDEAWTYLSTRNPLETDLNRMVRVDAFWQAWVAQVGAAADQTNVVPGEVDSGLGRFVRALGTGPLDASSLPLQPIPLEEGKEPVYEPQIAAVDALVARIAPFPAGPEGARARMAVLDGTGSLDHGMAAAVLFASIGGQIDKVGNAPAFGVETTQFVYFDDAALTRVQRMRDALGVGEIVKSDELNSAVDIVVVLGADAVGVDTGVSVPDASLAPTGAGG